MAPLHVGATLTKTDKTRLAWGVGFCILLLVVSSIPNAGSIGKGQESALGLIGIGILLYFLPAILARNKRNFHSVLALNFFLGWTLVGWVVALAWALMNDPPTVAIQQSAALSAQPSLFCSACGKYSQTGARFCQNCGQPFIVTRSV
jgi:Superinfection immunity protein